MLIASQVIHDIVKITVKRVHHGDATPFPFVSTQLVFWDANGNMIELSAFSKKPVAIEYKEDTFIGLQPIPVGEATEVA